MPTTSLTRDDWVDAATTALLRDGPDAVAVQPVARMLGATKGSFYWHFSGRPELLSAALERWTTIATDDVISQVEAAAATPAERLRSLVTLVTEAAVRHRGELRVLAATGDPAVAAAVAEVTERRVRYVTDLLRGAGVPAAAARHRAVLAYASYLGVAQLAAAAPATLPRSWAARDRLREELVATALADVSP